MLRPLMAGRLCPSPLPLTTSAPHRLSPSPPPPLALMAGRFSESCHVPLTSDVVTSCSRPGRAPQAQAAPIRSRASLTRMRGRSLASESLVASQTPAPVRIPDIDAERNEDVREVRSRSAWSRRRLRSGAGRCSRAWKDGRLSGWVERRSDSERMCVLV